MGSDLSSLKFSTNYQKNTETIKWVSILEPHKTLLEPELRLFLLPN